jgi:dTDP-4-amino-4,6-dideoxygalactose transaminase
MIEYENLAGVNARYRAELSEAFRQVMDSGWFILGKEVECFEKEFSSYLNASYCIGVASGLDALVLSLRACGFKQGDEVIVPANTYIATILSVIQCGLKPVLAEPCLHTCNINPEEVEKCITSRTRAVMVVHLYGKPCRMDRIMEICQKNQLVVIEDCAQSHGARFKGKMTGTFGHFGAFSFYPTKNLGALGDGGAVICPSEAHASLIRTMRNYGSAKKYYNDIPGANSRLDELQAAFLRVKLRHLDDLIHHKRKLASIYLKELKDDFIKPAIEEECFDVYHIFQIRHPQRDKLREYLLKKDIKTEIHYPWPPHRQKALQGIINGTFPITEEIHRTVLSLPLSLIHTEDDIYHIVEVMNKF